jgi:hypothetical protein
MKLGSPPDIVCAGREHPLNIEARFVAQTKQLIAMRAEFQREDGVLIAEASARATGSPFEPIADDHNDCGHALARRQSARPLVDVRFRSSSSI